MSATLNDAFWPVQLKISVRLARETLCRKAPPQPEGAEEEEEETRGGGKGSKGDMAEAKLTSAKGLFAGPGPQKAMRRAETGD